PNVATEIGLAAYIGDTTGNRPAPDLAESGVVKLLELYGRYEDGPWVARGSWIAGSLDNSGAITAANKQLSNDLGVARTPVGGGASALGVEVGYDLLFSEHDDEATPEDDVSEPIDTVPELGRRLDLFVRYDRYDSLAEVAEGVADNPRFDRETWTLGFNYFLNPKVLLKLDQSWRSLGSDQDENTLSFGMGYEF
ncbi:MAG: hypothetical protein ABI743_13075, partial [bacterium]